MATPKKSAQMAQKTLKFYSDKVAGHAKDENLETRMVDLVADLMHLAANKKIDFYAIVDEAHANFAADGLGGSMSGGGSGDPRRIPPGGTIYLVNHRRGRWTGDRISDQVTLLNVTNKMYFSDEEFDDVLRKVSEYGYDLEFEGRHEQMI